MAIKFEPHQPLTLHFPFGDFMEVNGQYGPQFLYTVVCDGLRDRLYATPRLHQQLQAAEVGPGSELTITKVEGEDHHKSWIVEPPAPETNGQHNGGVPALPADTGPNPQPPMPPDFKGMDQLMAGCLRASLDAWNGLDEGGGFGSEDVRAVGITLFLACARKGIAPLAIEEEEPL